MRRSFGAHSDRLRAIARSITVAYGEMYLRKKLGLRLRLEGVHPDLVRYGEGILDRKIVRKRYRQFVAKSADRSEDATSLFSGGRFMMPSAKLRNHQS